MSPPTVSNNPSGHNPLSPVNMPVKIVEVGPRDGLQNEKTLIPTGVKLDYIKQLVLAGLKHIEVTSFVSPKAIPQLADATELVQQLPGLSNLCGFPGSQPVVFSALVPNLKGLQLALESGIRSIAVFTATSDTFTQHNIKMTVEESLKQFEQVVQQALEQGMAVRGYISTAFYCPYEGKIESGRLISVCKALLDMGVEELSIGDTIGQATPNDITDALPDLIKIVPLSRLAMHFHDTNGLAIENVEAALNMGVRIFDSSTGGLGGCPYAPGASGNLPTERLVNYLHQHGFETGVDLTLLKQAASVIHQLIANTQIETE